MSLSDIEAIRCDHDGLKMAEVQDGHLILRKKHHGQTHVKIVALSAFGLTPASPQSRRRGQREPRGHHRPGATRRPVADRQWRRCTG